MFNVLPDILKKEIAAEYRFRLITTVCFFVLCIQIAIVVLLLPPWMFTFYKEKDAQGQISFLQQSPDSQNAEALKNVISSTNHKINIIHTTLVYPEIVPLLNNVLLYKNEKVRINNFHYTTDGAGKVSVVVGGIATTRESLVSFVKKLQDSGMYSSVDLPVSNLAKDKDIEFRMTLSIK